MVIFRPAEARRNRIRLGLPVPADQPSDWARRAGTDRLAFQVANRISLRRAPHATENALQRPSNPGNTG
jgi:hypothetical protein